MQLEYLFTIARLAPGTRSRLHPVNSSTLPLSGIHHYVLAGVCAITMPAVEHAVKQSVLSQGSLRAETRNPSPELPQEDASRYCPVCSQRLESRRCKLVCTVCGYYMSCSDYI